MSLILLLNLKNFGWNQIYKKSQFQVFKVSREQVLDEVSIGLVNLLDQSQVSLDWKGMSYSSFNLLIYMINSNLVAIIITFFLEEIITFFTHGLSHAICKFLKPNKITYTKTKMKKKMINTVKI